MPDEAESTSNAVPANEIYWPYHLLPADCMTARILVWGYDPVVTRGYTRSANKSNLFAHAKDLLYSLEREWPIGRRILFVAHSLGGLLVKEVLRRSETSHESTLQDIVSTAAIFFMGTPHRGSSDFANLGDTVRGIASIVLRVDSNATILRALGEDCPELELSRESFIQQWHKYNFKVKTFQESQGITGVHFLLSNQRYDETTWSFLSTRKVIELTSLW